MQYTYQIPVGGAKVLAWSAEKDLLLLRLNASLPAEAGPYFVGWGVYSLEQAVIISHPCGGPKKIAISDPWMIEFQQIFGRDIFNVVSWEEGEVMGGPQAGRCSTPTPAR